MLFQDTKLLEIFLCSINNMLCHAGNSQRALRYLLILVAFLIVMNLNGVNWLEICSSASNTRDSHWRNFPETVPLSRISGLYGLHVSSALK